VNIGLHLSFCISVHFFRYILRSRISRSYGSSIFNFLRNFHAVLHNGCTNLHSHQQGTRVSFSPHSHQHLLFVFFLMIAVLTVVKWYLIVALICINLMMLNTKHLSVCLLAICMSSLEKCLFSSSAHSLIVFFFFILSCVNCLCILDTKPLSVTSFTIIFSYFIRSFLFGELRSHGFLFCTKAFKFN